MPPKGGRYHHGDLRSALVDAAIAVIAERGVRGFSLAEATRRLGLTTAAPYRHFADRDELLAAVTARALSDFATMLGNAAGAADTPAQRLAAMAGAMLLIDGEYGRSGPADTTSEEPGMTAPRVHLMEITGQNRDRVRALRLHPGQELFVSSLAGSLDEVAATPELEPWYRAIYSGEEAP
jgi:AcrR family transcriptional regulator